MVGAFLGWPVVVNRSSGSRPSQADPPCSATSRGGTVTEGELLEHICRMAEVPVPKGQPPFVEVAIPLHPDAPVDYQDARSEAFEAVSGPADFIYHPPLGAPHIDVHRYPPVNSRRFWCYATNGMSDFAQDLPDGTGFRSELVCYSGSESARWPELLRTLGTFPFRCSTFLHAYHTVPFPEGVGDARFTYVMTVPPFLTPDLAGVQFLGAPLLVMSVVRITGPERERAVAESSKTVVDSLPDNLDTWLIDGRV
jgi:hypothetical protein